MYILKNIFLVTVFLITVFCSVRAEIPANTWGRLDIDAEKSMVELTPLKEELSGAVYVF